MVSQISTIPSSSLPVASDSQQNGGRISMPPRMTSRPAFRHEYPKYETTANGDVIVVEPSFDNECDQEGAQGISKEVWQSRSPSGDKVHSPGTRSSVSPPKPPAFRRRTHARNLSAQFFAATTITTEEDEPSTSAEQAVNPAKQEVITTSPAVGQKHRRMFSGGASNPPFAHRRINSIGNSAAVDRCYPRPGPSVKRHHHRENSAGLDMLSAAADVSKAELAAVAGESTAAPLSQPPSTLAPPWDLPSGRAAEQALAPSQQHSYAVPMTSYEYAPAPESGPMKPPPSRSYTPPRNRTYSPPRAPTAAAPPKAPQAAVPAVPGHHQQSSRYVHVNAVPPVPGGPIQAPPHFPPPPPGTVYQTTSGQPAYVIPPTNPRGTYAVQYTYEYDPQSKPPEGIPPPPPSQVVYSPAGADEKAPPSGQPSTTTSTQAEKLQIDERIYVKHDHSSPVPAHYAHHPWHHGAPVESYPGVQTYVAVGVDPGAKTVIYTSNAATPTKSGGDAGGVGPASSTPGHHHHRKLSSFSSVVLAPSIFSPPPGESDHPLKGHHRHTSSTASFLKGIDLGLEGHHRQTSSTASFLKGIELGADSYHNYSASASSTLKGVEAVPQGHHRHTSSTASFIKGIELGPEGHYRQPSITFTDSHHRQASTSSHHRHTSSTASFLNGIDFGPDSSNDVTFLRNLEAAAPSYGGTSMPLVDQNSAPVATDPCPPPQVPVNTTTPTHTTSTTDTSAPNMPETAATGGVGQKPAGTAKRVRRKCSIEGCQNRVVQGGLCIAHGAKRKTCKHPGCTKNVKKAGLCSTHGPARKRCEAEGCGKVAVQGGRCIAHGAKKKLCSVEDCTKQAILGGMCKKHHDKVNGIAPTRGKHLQQTRPLPDINTDPNAPQTCQPCEQNQAAAHVPPLPAPTAPKPPHPTHKRGLSIFQDLSADAVGNLLYDDPTVDPVRGVPYTGANVVHL